MNLEEIIRSGESETVEFKESFSDAVIETLSAFANASGGMVLVGIADDGTVKGKLMPGVTVERLLQGDYLSVMRNKQIARIFKEANEIEQYGSGIKRIINSCLAYNLPHPKFEEVAEGVRVTVFKTTQKTGVKTKVKTKVKASDVILTMIRGNPSITRRELAAHLNLTMSGIDWNLNKLKKEGRLKRIGPDKGGYWEIK